MNGQGASSQAALARFKRLGALEQILLTSDATVTPLLEHVVGERIEVTRVAQEVGLAGDRDRALLESAPDRDLLVRASELVGAESGLVYLKAVTIAAPQALPEELWSGLLRGHEPIGRLLRRQRLETFREILEYEVRGAGPEAEGFRRYRMFVAGAPALLITETFSFFNLRRRYL